MMRILAIVLCILSTISTVNAQSVEHRIWNRKPLNIILPVGQERIISFPGEVSIDVPASIKKISRIQIRSEGSVYWIAGREFNQKRIIVKSKFGRVYLLDVSASIDAPMHPLIIIDELIDNKHKKNTETGQSTVAITDIKTQGYDYVDLIRYAAQSIYSPKRLIKELPGITRFPVISKNLPLYRGQSLTVAPLAQWKTNSLPSLYVTALTAINTTSKLHEVDVRRIRGEWLARSAQHGAVGPKDSKTHDTTIYLISDLPFMEAIR